MKNVLSVLYNTPPKDNIARLKNRIRATRQPAVRTGDLFEVTEILSRNFEVYQSPNLVGITPEDFKASIQGRIGVVAPEAEHYPEDEIEKQRDFSIKFHWGHNHDFGNFKLDGRMADRHITLMALFTALFPVTLDSFKQKDIFDIGCWTGGTTLTLATIADSVYAIEEVNKYAETAAYLVEAFGLRERVQVGAKSIYDCSSAEFYDRFDVAYFPGVLYHLSDPVLALRILFNSLRPDGILLVESAGINSHEPICTFEGCQVFHSGTEVDLNRAGWDWFLPSPPALRRMMSEAGFADIEVRWHAATGRVFGFGRKTGQVGICRAGLSVPDIR